MWEHDSTAAEHALDLLRTYAVHELAYRAMIETNPDCSSIHRFWTDALNAHAMTAVNVWCMVFGSRGASGDNPTHWHNWIDKTHLSAARSSFRNHLDRGPIPSSVFDSLGREMREFRNAYSAHRDYTAMKPMPDLGKGLKVAIAFEDWFCGWTIPISSGNRLKDIEADLRDSYKAIAESVRIVVPLA